MPRKRLIAFSPQRDERTRMYGIKIPNVRHKWAGLHAIIMDQIQFWNIAPQREPVRSVIPFATSRTSIKDMRLGDIRQNHVVFTPVARTIVVIKSIRLPQQKNVMTHMLTEIPPKAAQSTHGRRPSCHVGEPHTHERNPASRLYRSKRSRVEP